METPWPILGALQKRQWLTSIDMKDAYFTLESTQPTDATFVSVTTAPHGNSQFCHLVSQPARDYLQKYSNQY